MPEDPARSLPALLAARAESAPAAPWLVYRDRLDWSWRSCAQVADQVARIAADLDLEVAARHPVAQRLDPECIALDISVQARGGVAVALVQPPQHRDLATVRSRLDRWQPAAIDLRNAARSAVEVTLGGRPAVLGPEAMTARSVGIDEQWRSTSSVRKPIALVCGSLCDPGVRALASWTLIRGAALALEPDPSLAAQAVRWIRPHVAVVPRISIPAVHEAVAQQKRRWCRLVLLGIAEETEPAEQQRVGRGAPNSEPSESGGMLEVWEDLERGLGIARLRTDLR